jgi:hypothetical protein
VSDYSVIAAVSGALRRILWDAFQPDPVINQLVTSENVIVFRNPTETARDSANRMSLWCYRVEENEHVKNQPMLGGATAASQRVPPLALNLYYLVTPFGPSGEADHLILGKAMQALYDNGVVLLRDPVAEIAEELRIIFCRLTLEELTRIWEALREPYRLSVCYQVRVTRVESQREPGRARILDRAAALGAIGAPEVRP